MGEVDAEITRILDIESRFGLNNELNEYLLWLCHEKYKRGQMQC